MPMSCQITLVWNCPPHKQMKFTPCGDMLAAQLFCPLECATSQTKKVHSLFAASYCILAERIPTIFNTNGLEVRQNPIMLTYFGLMKRPCPLQLSK